jgi:protocatechuate 3,4-dioxygenase beta subunit
MKWRFVALGAVTAAVFVVGWRSFDSAEDGDSRESARAGIVVPGSRADPRALNRASISGTVIDATGAPVPSARICAIAANLRLWVSMKREPRCATSDARGRYTIENLLAAKHSVSAMAKAYRPATYPDGDETTLSLLPGERRTVDLVLRRGGVELTGTVFDLTGGPIANALVASMVQTDAAGRFTLWFEPGQAYISVQADGYAVAGAMGTAPGNLDVKLVPESSISGTVVDAKTGDPVSGIEVGLTDATASWWGPVQDVTDDRGRFRIDGLLPDRYVVIARQADRTGLSDGSTLAGLGQHVDGLIIKVYPAVTITGRVVISGNPSVVCKQPSMRLRSRQTVISGEHQPDGTVRVTGALPGTYDLAVGCRGALVRAPSKLDVADRDLTDLVWEVAPGATIRGRVLDRSGAPIEGATVQSDRSRREVSDHHGNYQLAGLSAGKHVVRAETLQGLATIDIDVVESSITTKDLVIDPAGSVGGVVVDTTGKPVSNVLVWIAPLDPSAHALTSRSNNSTTTGPDGTFVLEGYPSGEYGLGTSFGELRLRPPKPDPEARYDHRVAVRASSRAMLHVVVDMPLLGAIQGTVIDGSGKPISDAFVVATRELDGTTFRRGDDSRVLTTTDGSFAIANLMAGHYTVRAFREGSGEAFVEHVSIGSAIRVQIKPTGSIEGSVRIRGKLGEDLLVTVMDTRTMLSRSERYSHARGRYAIRDLPAGLYRLNVSAGDVRDSAEVMLGEGERKTNVDLDLVAPVRLSGRVIDLATKQPVTGIVMHLRFTNPQLDTFPGGERGSFTTDAQGRFTFHVTAGSVTISGDGEPRGYGYAAIVRDVGSTDVDLGDLGVVKRRAEPAKAGSVGIIWIENSADMQSEDRTFKVGAIDPVGPAAKTPLQVGDIVTTIDGIDVRGANRGAGWTLLQAPPGTSIQLGLARGNSVTVVSAAQ